MGTVGVDWAVPGAAGDASSMLAQLREWSKIGREPQLGLWIVDANMPPELCARIPRDEEMVRLIFGPSADEAWGAFARLRPQDYALLVSPAAHRLIEADAEAHRRTMDPAVRTMLAISGVPVWWLSSDRRVPWRRLELAQSITEWLDRERRAWNGG